MSALTRLEALTGIDILKELTSNHLHITLANKIQLKLHTNSLNSCTEIFEEWLAGQSTLPPTWENLLQVLREINMKDLARQIEQFFQSTTGPKKKASEVMGEEKELVDSLTQSLKKVERDLQEDEEQNQLLRAEIEYLKAENKSLKAENESLQTEIEVLRHAETSGTYTAEKSCQELINLLWG